VKVGCRELHLELPTPDRVERLVPTAIATFDTQLTTQVVARLSPATCQRLDALLHERPATDSVISGQTLLADLKLDAGALSVQTVKHEKAKLDAIAALELPAEATTITSQLHLQIEAALQRLNETLEHR
jgi:hypothetical protein